MAQDLARTADTVSAVSAVSAVSCPDLLDAVLDAVLVVDRDGTIVFANRAVERVFGWTPVEIVGRSVEVLVPAAARDRHAALRTTYAGHLTPRPMGGGLDFCGVRSDGSTFPAEVSLAATATADGPLVVAVVRDLTTRYEKARAERIQLDLERRLRASDERFRVAFDAAPVGMLMVSARPGRVGDVLKVNRALCELMGRSEADLLGQCTLDVFLPERVEDALRVQQRLLDGEITCADALERRVVHAAGHDIWVEISIVLVRDEAGEPDYFFVTHVVDVTSQREVRLEARRRAERDQRVATVLSEALVPDVPRRVGRTAVATRYQPAAGEAVGGDWLDVFTLPDGRVGVTVGDVAGHGIGSASTMSRLRYALRTLANTGAGPAEVVSRLNQAMHLSELTSADIEIATVVHAQFEPGTGVLRHCSAGHLPLIGLAPPPGEGVRLLWPVSGPPIGVVPDAEYDEHLEVLEPGSLLVGYTDGLVERRERSLGDGLVDLVQGLRSRLPDLASAVGRADVEPVADAVLAAAPPGRRDDDTAVVVVALPSRPEPGQPGGRTVSVDPVSVDAVSVDAVSVDPVSAVVPALSPWEPA